MKRVMIGIRIDQDVKKEFQKWCIENETSIQRELENYILKTIKQDQNK